jgi:hypothetical protein
VRDHLHRGAEIIATALFGDDLLVDAAGGDVVGLGSADASEAFVVAEIQVGLGAVVSDEDFAVLIRAHRARIDVEIGVQFAEADPVSSGLEERAKGGGGDALPKGRDDASGNKHVARHYPSKSARRFARAGSSLLTGQDQRADGEPAVRQHRSIRAPFDHWPVLALPVTSAK